MAEPKKYNVPIPGPGREAIWDDPDDMWQRGLEYFAEKNQAGERYTIAGLAIFLDLSYQGLNEYGRKPRFSAIVSRLKSKIVEQGEKALFDKDTVNGAKYHLSVMGVRDVQVIESTNSNTNVTLTDEALAKATPEQLEVLRSLFANIKDKDA